jgi:Cdc6-like AAA superfamily ATPase
MEVIKVLKVVIKNTKVTVFQSEKGLIISDAEVNRIINQSKSSRGRMMSKEKLVKLAKPYRFNGSLHYPLIEKLDDCYFNNVMLTK